MEQTGTAVPRLQSWLDWRNSTSEDGEPWKLYKDLVAPEQLTKHNLIIALRQSRGLDNINVCPLCNGDLTVNTENGERYCVCYVLDYQDEMAQRLRKIRSRVNVKSLNDLSADHIRDPLLRTKFTRAIEIVKGWMKYPGPDSWLVISGKVGNGKTHIVTAIAAELSPMAAFVTAEDLGQMFYDAIDDHSTGEKIRLLSTAPILIIDDIVTAHEYAKGKLSHIINNRYKYGKTLPTVVTTNYTDAALYSWDNRIASRLLDKDLSHYIRLDLPDYRTDKREVR